MKKKWISDVNCTGCGACANVCPKNAITIVEDSSGHLYPKINHDLCINCNLCERICGKVFSLKTNNLASPKVMAAWSKNKIIRDNSTSGGIFSELAIEIINRKGVVVGAKYNDNNIVEHCMIDKVEDLDKIRQSKYTQSNTKQIYRKIKEKLKEKTEVLFCGAPCQVAALKTYIGDNTEFLITVDFICRGVNSVKAYRYWLDEIENKYQQKIIKVWFKYKQNGWKSSPLRTRIDFKNGNHIVMEDSDNIYMKGYLNHNLYIRPSCTKCKFKGLPRNSDITLADFWGIEEKLDDDKGVSLILLNNIKGLTLYNKVVPRLNSMEKKYDDVLKGNPALNKSTYLNKNSERFLKSLDHQPFSLCIKKYSKVNPFKRVCKRIKNFIVK